MKKSDFYYELPAELIAQTPALMRDSSRLMIIRRDRPEILHQVFSDVSSYLSVGDCLVLNDTRVMPARLLGQKEGSGGKIEFVLLKRLEEDIWEIILKPGRKAREGSRFVFGNGALTATVLEVLPDGNRKVQFFYVGVFEEVLSSIGIMPLPPYITETLSDAERYQTVYNRAYGSAAAPTAGLHFTPELLQKLQNQGVSIVYLTLHVGLGTFRPVKVDDILQHKMHQEFYEIGEVAAKTINEVKQNGGRVIAVGTTSSRVLESVSNQAGEVIAGTGWTDIFIYPGYQFKIVSGLITNFHLPESTLLMLVSALCGRERILEAYHLAIQEKYRFFSFGDAMLIL